MTRPLSAQGSRPLPVEALAACAALVAAAAQHSTAAANQSAAATASLKLLQLSGTGEGSAAAAADVGPEQLQWRAAVPAALVASVQVRPLHYPVRFS